MHQLTTLYPRKTSVFSGKYFIIGDFNIQAENKVMEYFIQEHTFYNTMKQNTCFKGDGGFCIHLLITNSKLSKGKFERQIPLKLTWMIIIIWYILCSKQYLKRLNQRNQYTAISNNMIVTNLNWIFLIVCLLWEPMQPSIIILFQFYVDMHLRKQKVYEGIVSKTRQISQNILVTVWSLSDNKTC